MNYFSEDELKMLPKWNGKEIVDGFGTVYDVVDAKSLSDEEMEKALQSIACNGISFVKFGEDGVKHINNLDVFDVNSKGE